MIKKNTLDKNRTIFLIDGSSLLYRAYYGTHPLHTSTGTPVQAVYSFCRMIKRLVALFDPEYMILVWDSKGKTIRSEIFPAYKATRQAPPSDLFMQKEYCIEFADLIGLKQVAQEGVEADDLLFSLTKELVGIANKNNSDSKDGDSKDSDSKDGDSKDSDSKDSDSKDRVDSVNVHKVDRVESEDGKDNNSGDNVVLVTSDKDMGQLIADNVFLYDPLKEILFSVDNFTEKIGFPISKLPFYFSLLGDSSDNIPGVHGIGKKTALELVTKFNSLEDLYVNLDTVSSKRARVALESQRDNAFLSQDLFLLRYYKTDIKKEDAIFDKHNWHKAASLFKELEFKSLLKDLEAVQGGQQAGQEKAKDFEQDQEQVKIENQDSIENKDQREVFDIENVEIQKSAKNPEGQDSLEILEILKKYDFRLISTEQELMELCILLKNSIGFAYDTETTGLQALAVDLVGISFSVKEGQAFYIACDDVLSGQELSQQKLPQQPYLHVSSENNQKLSQQLSIFQLLEQKASIDSAAHNQELDNQKLSPQLSIHTIVSYLKPIFADSSIEKYAHNSKYDKLVLSRYGIEVCGPCFDTYIAASLVTKSWQSAGLKSLSILYFNEPMLSYDQVMSMGPYKNFSQVPADIALLYAASDAHQTLRLVSVLKQELEKQQLMVLFLTVETPLIQILYEMEKEGIILNTAALEKVNKVVTHDLDTLKETIFAVTGAPINLNSSKQVGQLLFVTLGLTPTNKKGKSGSHSTGYEVLAELAKKHLVPELLLKYRELTKLKNTYLDSLPSYINQKTGRIHTSFSQARVATGRLSSSDPNMQNIPNNGYGIAIRGAFRPSEHFSFVSADYSQIELRVLAHLSQDRSLIHAFRMGQDIHMQTAARLFDVEQEQVTHEQRQMGKRINFSILYGLTPYGLSKDLGIPFKEAKKFIEKYFEQYPGVQVWMDGIIEFAKEHGYVETFWGRRRDISSIYEKNNTLYQEAKRVAINTVAQGTAAEIMKQGMIKVRNAFSAQQLDAHLVLQIHDELLVSARADQAKEVEACIVGELESVVAWSIPFIVSTRIGADWKAVSK